MKNFLKFTILVTLTFSTIVAASEVPSIKKSSLEKLDRLLSPFEDLTEYALKEDFKAMKNGYKKIKSLKESGLLGKSVNNDVITQISQDIASLNNYINIKNYPEAALQSTKIFKTITNNFVYAKYIRKQIYIENLDGMGFEVLSLLSKKSIDYIQIQSIINKSQKSWISLRESLKDENSIDSFDLLFKALYHATMKRDSEMLGILASMDLALVDIIEKQLH